MKKWDLSFTTNLKKLELSTDSKIWLFLQISWMELLKFTRTVYYIGISSLKIFSLEKRRVSLSPKLVTLALLGCWETIAKRLVPKQMIWDARTPQAVAPLGPLSSPQWQVPRFTWLQRFDPITVRALSHQNTRTLRWTWSKTSIPSGSFFTKSATKWELEWCEANFSDSSTPKEKYLNRHRSNRSILNIRWLWQWRLRTLKTVLVPRK